MEHRVCCNTFNAKLNIARLGGFELFVILAFFLGPFPERFLISCCGFRFYFWLVFVPEVVLGLILEATNILCKKIFGAIQAILGREGWGPYANLWSGAV